MVMEKCVFLRRKPKKKKNDNKKPKIHSLMVSFLAKFVTWTPDTNYDNALCHTHIGWSIDHDMKIQFVKRYNNNGSNTATIRKSDPKWNIDTVPKIYRMELIITMETFHVLA